MDNNIYSFVKDCQTSRLTFFTLSTISFILLIVNEIQFFYSNLKFTIVSCSTGELYNDDQKYDKPTDQSLYNLTNCINYQIPTCISEIFQTGNPSLEFDVPILKNPYPTLKDDENMMIFALILFSLLTLTFYLMLTYTFIRRSRYHLLLSMDIVVKTTKKYKPYILFALIGLECIIYTGIKFSTVASIQQDVSLLNCYGYLYGMDFSNELTSTKYGIVINFLLFAIIFKDPFMDMWNSFKDHYNEIGAVKLLHREGGQGILESFKSFQIIEDTEILAAMKQYLAKKYPNQSPTSFGFKNRVNIFESFKSTKEDIIPAIIEYREMYPDKFKNIFEAHQKSKQIQKNSKDILVGDTESLIQ